MSSIALPMVVSLACDTVMVFTDRLFLARISPELMNASMGGGLTVFMLSSFFFGLLGYVTALTAQYFGAKRRKECSSVVFQAVIFSMLAYPVILSCRPLAHGLFELMGVSAGQMGPQKLYLDILLWGSLISLLRTVLSGFFSGIGRTSIVMAASITAMIFNVVLNYILIYGKFGCPSLGIEGAAYGTIAGGCLGLVILAAAYTGKGNRAKFHLSGTMRFDPAVAGKLLKFGSPGGFEMLLNLIAFNSLVLLFHSHSPATATAATIVFNWDLVSFVPLVGIEISVTSLVGRFMGAGDPETAHKSVMAGLKIALAYSTIVLALFVGFAPGLVEVFRPVGNDTVFNSSTALAVSMVRMASLYVLMEAMLIVFIGALRGAGDTLWAMVFSVSVHWAMVAALFVILRIMGLPPKLGWGVVVSIFMLFSVVVYLRYRGGKWKSIRVVQPEPVSFAGDGFHDTTDL